MINSGTINLNSIQRLQGGVRTYHFIGGSSCKKLGKRKKRHTGDVTEINDVRNMPNSEEKEDYTLGAEGL